MLIISVCLFLVNLYTTLSTLTQSLCQTYDKTQIYPQLSTVINNANKIIFSSDSQFKEVINGFMKVIVDEDAGEQNGGSTNSFGSYGTIYFNATEYYPNDSDVNLCDIPKNEGNKRCINDMTMSQILGPRDVLAFIGCSPPSMRYFSLDHIIGTRVNETYPFYPGINFGDTINNNNVVIGTGDSDGTAFDQPVIFLVGADEDALKEIASAYESSSNGAFGISLRAISASIVRLWDRSNGKTWSDSKPDFLGTIFRMTAPTGGLDDPSYTAYKNEVWPVRYYKALDDAISTNPLNPVVISRYGENVINEVATLGDTFNVIQEKIVESLSSTYKYVNKESQTFLKPGCYDDWDYILSLKDNSTYVAGTRDALYGTGMFDETVVQSLLFSSQSKIVVVGVLHKNVINCAYNSVGLDIMNGDNFDTIDTIWWIDYELQGSAARYLPDMDTSISDLFFAIDVMPPGGCGDSSFCYEVSDDVMSLQYAIPFIAERVYAVGETSVGAAYNTTIASQALIFKKLS